MYSTEVSSSFLSMFPTIKYVGSSNSELYNLICRFQKQLEAQSGCNNQEDFVSAPLGRGSVHVQL